MIIMFALESFFGGVFLDYGYKTLQYFTGHADNSTFHPMIEAFPTIAKCEFFKYGPSGTIEKHDLVCLLPQNIINEKIFLLLWFWFVFLSTCSCIQIVYIAALFISPYLRTKLLERNGKMVTTEQLEKLVRKLDTGDFFLLMTIISNLDGISVRDVLQGLISGILGKPTMGNKDESCPNGFGKTVENMFSPNAPTYRPFNMEDVDPVEYKRRMEADDTCV
uniref:Innexin n=2 Tax=Hirondellea gigas TaxID=1518452 RepID=A0A6A7FU55_9CRUS